MDWPSFLTGAGAIPVIAGLSAWLGKIWANRILEQDRTKYHTQHLPKIQCFMNLRIGSWCGC